LDNPPRAAAAIWLAPLLVSGLFAQAPAQTPPKISARDLYYEDVSKSGSVVPAVAHLGLRYNLVKIDPATRAEQAVDPAGNFKEGDCFVVEFTPNQNGRLYVLNLASSGEWQFLMPSAEMPSEASAVQANKTVRIPRDFCFRLDAKRGVETLMVATTGGPEDLNSGGQKQMVNQVQEWREKQMAGRDLVVEKIAESEPGRDRPYTVYAVDTAGMKSSHVVLEIKIRHE
jgi:hypothetical protein